MIGLDIETVTHPKLPVAVRDYLLNREKSIPCNLHPVGAQIACVGLYDSVTKNGVVFFVDEDGTTEIDDTDNFSYRGFATEALMLTKVWSVLDRQENLMVVTYNGAEFDLPMLFARSAYCGVASRITKKLHAAKPWETTHVDLSLTFRGEYKRMSQASLEMTCISSGLPSPKTGITGKDVDPIWTKEPSRRHEVIRYCGNDSKTNIDLFVHAFGSE
jgi:DNA polymerase elongation subunit (family B)